MSNTEILSPLEAGTISVQMENIFPIIKKWLYNDKEIFLRELISNGVDAISKLRHLTVIGQAEKSETEFKVEIKIDKEAKTLSIIDNGIGMTAEEVKKYINQVAFSSASEFMHKFGDKNNDIIGHFGLGFYSAFTVASKVEIHTRSYQKEAEAVIWSCDGSPNFELHAGQRESHGTEIKLFLLDDELEFAEEARIQHLVKKYCDFLPVPIEINEKVANRQKPLWERSPQEVSKEEYLEFYRYLYPFAPEPYFWIHLNVEVPFVLKGILFFPKLSHELDPGKGNIKLYCHDVYVSDHVEDFIPRFLVTLQGAIDCPDIPLNVSRSMLQNDPYVQRVSTHITKKVADRLKELYNKDREEFLRSWQDIHSFIKVGMMEDDKFYDKVKDIVVFKSTRDDYITIEEYLVRNPQLDKKVYYTSDEVGQAHYLELFKQQGLEVLSMNTLIDTHFIQFMEYKNHEVKFARIDSDISESLVEKDRGAQIVDPKTNKTSDETLEELFKAELNVPKLHLKVESLKSEDIPAVVLLPENARRLHEMSQFMQQAGMNEHMDSLLEEHTLVVNSNNPLIQSLRKLHGTISEKDNLQLICRHVYDLAMMAHRPLRGEKLTHFLSDSNKVLQALSNKL
jgi:molecular chaperone HtpG